MGEEPVVSRHKRAKTEIKQRNLTNEKIKKDREKGRKKMRVKNKKKRANKMRNKFARSNSDNDLLQYVKDASSDKTKKPSKPSTRNSFINKQRRQKMQRRATKKSANEIEQIINNPSIDISFGVE